jgi:hypothetical protein
LKLAKEKALLTWKGRSRMERPLSKITTALFLLCVAAASPLALAEYCSGGDDPNAPLELCATLDNLLAWTMLACIVVALARAIYRRMTARQMI